MNQSELRWYEIGRTDGFTESRYNEACSKCGWRHDPDNPCLPKIEDSDPEDGGW